MLLIVAGGYGFSSSQCASMTKHDSQKLSCSTFRESRRYSGHFPFLCLSCCQNCIDFCDNTYRLRDQVLTYTQECRSAQCWMSVILINTGSVDSILHNKHRVFIKCWGRGTLSTRQIIVTGNGKVAEKTSKEAAARQFSVDPRGIRCESMTLTTISAQCKQSNYCRLQRCLQHCITRRPHNSRNTSIDFRCLLIGSQSW